MSKQITPYGSWKSPIMPELVVASALRLGHIALDGEDIYWIETRPLEAGRNVIVRRAADGQISDVTPPPFSARTRVHEYGGGDFTVADGVVYFSNESDQRLYCLRAGDAPQPLTPPGAWRYADGVIDARRGRWVGVREDHSQAGQPPTNCLVSLSLDGRDQAGQVLASGHNFYATPRLSPDGNRLSYLTWDNPDMPWDGSEVWVAELDNDGGVTGSEKVAGGRQESIFQPAWSPGGVLHFTSDRSGWWNLYRWRDRQIEPLYPQELEFGRPHWVFGTATYDFKSDEQIVCSYASGGKWCVGRLNPVDHELEALPLPYWNIGDVRVGKNQIVLVGGSPAEPTSLVRWVELPEGQGRLEGIRRSSQVSIDAGYLSQPQALEFPTQDGLTAYAFFYPPCNRDHAAPAGQRPPLLVFSHGGPTGAASASLSLPIQFWTSRGFAVLDVDYGGSVGYGRAYRERLKQQWGIVDVVDCINAARYVAERGWVDADHMAIRGGSAGGYTTLCALTFHQVFKAGASYFGVSDLEALAQDTHKFEARYLDGLVGPYPQQRQLYRDRSPIHFTDRLAVPMIFLQGLQDPVVPPAQSEKMFEAVRARGLPTAYVPFEGERHGFRRAENIKRAMEAELYFYSKVFGFELAEPVEPVEIANWK